MYAVAGKSPPLLVEQPRRVSIAFVFFSSNCFGKFVTFAGKLFLIGKIEYLCLSSSFIMGAGLSF